MKNMFQPKIFECMKHYSSQQLIKDIFAGMLVAVIAFPLSVALAISSGLGPERGLYAAIIGGFFVSLFGGSKVNIGGITAATVMTVFTIVGEYGLSGLAVATVMAGIMLVFMGFLRLGVLLKFIPRTITLGFTAAIGIGILSNQIKGFFGLEIDSVPVKMIEKIPALLGAMGTMSVTATAVGVVSVIILVVLPKINDKIPNSLAAILIMTPVVKLLNIPVATIKSVYGDVPSHFPAPELPNVTIEMITDLLPQSLTLAILVAIVSLLACAVTDGLMGEKHDSNQELIAEGIANIFCGLFGAPPVAGAVARASNNVKNGGRTPIAGIVHSITVTLILLFMMPLAGFIPMPVLSAVLIVVAINMLNVKEFIHIGRHAPKSDFIVLIATLCSGVLVDLLFAVEVGIVATAILFMKRMSEVSEVHHYEPESRSGEDYELLPRIPKYTVIYELMGPMFFAGLDTFHKIVIPVSAKCLILEMHSVPALDNAGVQALDNLYKRCGSMGVQLILSDVHAQPNKVLGKYGLSELLGEENICSNLSLAIERAYVLTEE